MVFEYTICIRHTAGYIPNNSRISACAYANKWMQCVDIIVRHLNYFEQIYHGWAGYLQNIAVKRR
jgi:hypothetical protein